MARLAVVLFNLGGPDRPEAVRPFLINLFQDPAIIPLPSILRWPLARLIATRRLGEARRIYERLGGRSPLLDGTRAQAAALERRLAVDGEARVFVAMRYWHPLIAQAAREVAAFAPDRVVLLPLYPQFSTTTTGSSLGEWERAAGAAGVTAPTHAVCCYPTQAGWIAAQTQRIREAIAAAARAGRPRVLFSAHGLPEKVVAGGDPYQWQVEATAAAIVAAAGIEALDHVVCYQSRVGPLRWIGPSTAAEIERAGREGRPLVVAPIAFVSEHSETLVELDIEYRALATRVGVPAYVRVATVGDDDSFIDGLAALVRDTLGADRALRGDGEGRLCPARFGRCPLATQGEPSC